MRVKICGITKPDQGRAIAELGATALGFICVPGSPRYVSPQQIREVVNCLPQGQTPDRIGVFVDANLTVICQTAITAGLTGIQLHGQESPNFCQQLRQMLPGMELIKALRVQTLTTLHQGSAYQDWIDTLLLDAYHPQRLGGTGQILDWQQLQDYSPPLPWFLAGGLTPDNVLAALGQLKPNGIDLSSGVERSPGDKDLDRVARLFEQLRP
ncbi:N-(5'-phosphoribosyl)anthranilate isomerase [Neosynechococcus sphagnicola sy1]|uniref:N-(5'-phosphoribosyl)anthranilate isomerase n=1 Tax=Neosynechococcus sphagnicola sy1 TaxID=1497020 RepID=A0A098TP73_9CYAN|nr:phosphoribosylanthranilate isomerase [Neosynechococcus sphagnicola]KGF73682.1 N-(5'-phosphoribosyl)anthranilate isomerase [Neosynechococcus sphagnicola sy1]